VQILTRYQARTRPQVLTIDVIDTGIGMTPEQLDNLFQPFQQGDTSMSRRYGGSGLGLAICRQLAMVLDGEITAESVPGEGSSFTLTLQVEVPDGCSMVRNVAMRPASPETLAVEKASDTLSGTILLAEDGNDNQVLLSTLLRRLGLTVVLAENGKIASELAIAALRAGAPFDLVLMDMQMPVLDGYAATRNLRRDGYDRPIVALTAHAMEGERERCIEAGCDDYLTKPVDRRALATLVTAIVSKSEVSKVSNTSEGGALSSSSAHAIRSEFAEDPEMVELVKRFVHSMPACTAALRAAAEGVGATPLVDLVHQLKGAAGGYGFGVITTAAARLEQVLREPQADRERGATLLDDLVGLCSRVRA
jgi:CheY-like chemotaxis protein